MSASDNCDAQGHDFMPKRTTVLLKVKEGSNFTDISELYCVKCGVVCFLRGAETETNIIVPRAN